MSTDWTAITTVLCDADGNLFPSEEPAYDASVTVTNAFLADMGIDEVIDPVALRRESTGKNFRSTMIALLARHDVTVSQAELERWVTRERLVVTEHLAAALGPDDAVLIPLHKLAQRYLLASVSSSALSRLAACFTATGLDALLPPARRFSAEDSLQPPVSKPDPAIYRYACDRLEIDPAAALAVEDSVPGVQSAVAAGVATVGNVQFVAADEVAERVGLLREAGAGEVVASWSALAARLAPERELAPEAR